MKRSRRTFLAILAAAGATAGALYVFGLQDGLPGGLTTALAPAEPVRISIASSVTKQNWLKAAAESFSAADIRTASGAPITIDISSVLSGESMLQIADGTLTPTIWSPGETAWVDQLDERWGRANPKPIVSAPCAPTVLTPVGLAMWRPMAEALGWPDSPVSWKMLVDLANDPEGWATFGHPEWGRLRLGHTHPQYSSAGLLFLASVIYATTGKTEGITAADIYDPAVEEALRVFAQNTSKYGMITTDLLSSMAQSGPSFLHAAAAFEEGTVRFNVDRAQDLRWPLAFIFPQEGTFWSDHPFCILDQSGWVTPEQAEAAALFRDHLLSGAVQATAGDFYVRPLSQSTPLGDRLTLANGTDPDASPATVPAFAIPSPEVSEAIIDQFRVTKRKATVVVVLDVSGSMEGEPIKTATEATAEFLDRLDPRDSVALLMFNDQVTMLTEVRPVSQVAEQVRSQVLSLTSGGGTNLHGAVCRAAKVLADAQKRDLAEGENRLYGMVLLSDGKDTTGEVTESRMMQTCLQTGAEIEGPRLFAIAFGDGADGAVLNRLARETNGAVFSADPASIGAAYLKISAEQ
jgi:Ca-activated chloride channel family protein